jgi:hypothetical protein
MFTCPLCGFVSHNANDARERYCGRCHLFVDDGVIPFAMRTVLRAIQATQPPYSDEVRRRSRLTDALFETAISALIDRRLVQRFSAPKGSLLYAGSPVSV